ncbi:MAG: hypothetical protein OK422_00115 [Thaumarchaeota archaeon]|nr:hypothetical protein [Nitrososphaerota archaeon]
MAISVVAADVTGNQALITPFALLAILTTFYFIDSSVLAAKRSDPLLRDSCHWTRLRLLLWPVLAGLVVVSGVESITVPSPSLVEFLLIGSPYFVGLGAGLVALPVAALRSRDATLRGHFKWFGTFAVFLLLFVIVSAPEPPINFGTNSFTPFVILYFEAAFVTMLVAGYSLYRSAKSLAPLNRLS